MTTEPDVEITVRLNGLSKTFTASATTTGGHARAVRALVTATADDACKWAIQMEAEAEKAARPTRPMLGRLR